jgi:hypothetical protein
LREPGRSFGRKNFKNDPGFSDCGALHDNGLVNFNIHQARASKDTVNSRSWEAQKRGSKKAVQKWRKWRGAAQLRQTKTVNPTLTRSRDGMLSF